MIKTKFFCVQPIELSNDIQFSTYANRRKIATIKQECLEWLDCFKKTSDVYSKISCINRFEDNENLVSSFINSEPACQNIRIKNVTSYLLFDQSFISFFIYHEAEIEYHSLLEFNHQPTPYNIIRNAFVKEKNDSTISEYVNHIQNISISQISTLLKTNINNISIQPNTGNITNIIFQNSSIDTCDHFIKLNTISERLPQEISPIKFKTTNEYYNTYFFSGRFHTIIVNEEEKIDRYIPLQFHIQYMWYSIKKLNVSLKNLNLKNLHHEKNTKQLIHQLDEIINFSEMFLLFNEEFKLSIEGDYHLLYRHIENRWSIPQNLKQTKQFISFLKEFIQREHQQKSSRVDEKRNYILFIIALVQIITIISVWNDYLNLLHAYKSHDIFFDIISTAETFSMMNMLLPITLVILIIATLIMSKK